MEIDTLSKRKTSRTKVWSTRFDYVLNLMGMLIGLGNIWRFPFLCYKNGGGSFLIPYFSIIAFVVFPIMILESSMGQHSGKSAVKSWRLIPLMQGIGLASPISLFYCNIYNPIILCWSARWFVACFNRNLPWMSCDNIWNTNSCLPIISNKSDLSTELPDNGLNFTQPGFGISNDTLSSVQEFWRFNVLGLTKGLEEHGGIKWDLFGCLAVIWIITYFCIWKGIKWTTKIVYVTATLPLVMVLVVVIRGATLEGARDGINLYLKPDFSKLLHIQIWMDACSQVFYSCCICTGTITTMSRFNQVKDNFLKDYLILIFMNSGASFLSGFAIFSVLGYLAHIKNTTVAEVAELGPGLVFEAYPTALSFLPGIQFWSAMFFLMIILLGLDGQFVFQECFIASLHDLWPQLTKRFGRKIITAVVCCVMFLIGLSMVTRGGMFVFSLFDYYAVSGWCIFFIGTCECVSIGWFYGADKWCNEMKRMLGFEYPRFFFKFCWKFFSPILTSFIMVYTLLKYKPLVYDRNYIYPLWANVLGWAIALSSMSIVPITAIVKLTKAKGNTLVQKFQSAIVPIGEESNMNGMEFREREASAK